jgi:hypothetical protein
MDIEEAHELLNEFTHYRNVKVDRVYGSGDSPDYEVIFELRNIKFSYPLALRKFLDAMELEREYKAKRK